MNSLFLSALVILLLKWHHIVWILIFFCFNLCATIVLQSIITLSANFSFTKILLECFFDSSTSLYLCFLWSEWYFVMISHKSFLINPSFICFSVNHIISLPFISMLFLLHLFLLMSTIFILFCRSFKIFFFFFCPVVFFKQILLKQALCE